MIAPISSRASANSFPDSLGYQTKLIGSSEPSLAADASSVESSSLPHAAKDKTTDRPSTVLRNFFILKLLL